MNELKKDEDVKVQDEQARKTEKPNVLVRFIKKYVKYGIGLLLIILIVSLLIKFSSNLKHKEVVVDFGFKDVGELVTQEWYGRIVEKSTKDRTIFKTIKVPFTMSRLIFSLDVEVLAGIDFNEIEYTITKDNVVKVKLPKAKIYKAYQVANSYIDYIEEESLFSNITSAEKHKIEDAMIDKAKKLAIDRGILEKADKNAKKIIEQIIKSNNKNYKIEWSYK